MGDRKQPTPPPIGAVKPPPPPAPPLPRKTLLDWMLTCSTDDFVMALVEDGSLLESIRAIIKVPALDPARGTPQPDDQVGTPPSADDQTEQIGVQTVQEVYGGQPLTPQNNFHRFADDLAVTEAGLRTLLRAVETQEAELTRRRAEHDSLKAKVAEFTKVQWAMKCPTCDAYTALLIDLRALITEALEASGDRREIILERIKARLSREPHQDTPQ